MSPVAAPARRAPAPKAAPRKAPARPNLRVVAPVQSRAPRAPFLLFSILLVGSGLVALLVLNTVVAQDAFTLHDLDASMTELAEREQRLRQEIAALEAPEDLAQRARGLGLVQAGDPVFVAPNGRVYGNPVPATAPEPVLPASPAVPASTAAPRAAPPEAKTSASPTASPKP